MGPLSQTKAIKFSCMSPRSSPRPRHLGSQQGSVWASPCLTSFAVSGGLASVIRVDGTHLGRLNARILLNGLRVTLVTRRFKEVLACVIFHESMTS
jgi:hypothetical protein